MIQITDEKMCCGCGACVDICPKKCIEMKEGTLGHLFPMINKPNCISCELCSSICPMINERNNKTKGISFIALNNNYEVRKKSSSGGLFYTFAKELIKKGFTVYGARFNDSLNLITTSTNSIDNLNLFCKSKYIQSKTIGVYRQIKQDLDEGKKVMFCGTPCQNAALVFFLKKDYENLILIDFFCHGVPSQEYFNKCKQLVERDKRIKILDYQYRTKIKNGCTPHYYTYRYEKNGKIYSKTDFYYNSPNYAAFQAYINLRESCYNCKFSNENRYSDITIGDFHDIERYNKNINRFDGVSTLIVNTDKGMSLLTEVKHELYLEKIDINTLKKDHVIFSGGTTKPSTRNEFVYDYDHMTFDALNKKWFGKKKYIKQIIYYHLPKFMKRALKK